MGDEPRDLGEKDPAVALYSLFVAVVRHLPRDISPTQSATLSTLERDGPRRITDLAAIHGVAQPSMTALVAGLEQAGYVIRERHLDDKRVSLVVLTAAGREYVARRRRAGAESLARLIIKLSAEERATLETAAPVLDKLRELEEGRARSANQDV